MPEQKISVKSDMYEAMPYKPVHHIEGLINSLVPQSNFIRTNAKQIINSKINHPQQCYLLLEGTVALFRSRDNLMLNSESAPYIFGFSNQRVEPDYMHMQTLENCVIASITLTEAFRIVSEKKLWENLAQMLIYTAGRIYDQCMRIYAPSSYEIIRSQLYELINESEYIRMRTTAAGYIQSRTFLSRSSIMKILADLRKGGYIITQRGMLIDIPQLIPAKY